MRGHCCRQLRLTSVGINALSWCGFSHFGLTSGHFVAWIRKGWKEKEKEEKKELEDKKAADKKAKEEELKKE